jgi:hypothetical protein
MQLRKLARTLAAGLCLAAVHTGTAHAALESKRVCVYTQHSVSTLQSFDAMVGRDIDCVLVYNDASPDWTGWEKPWFIGHPNPDLNWAKWVAAGAGRQLIVTQNLFPSSVDGTDWRTAGARGDYESHAVALAQNLVAAGLGNSIIRLAHEANGDWYPDSVGSSTSDYQAWVQFWRNTVLAMKSVPGAHFKFDWSVNANYRNIPLDQWYPGDDVVDYIGIDAYDSGITSQLNRWATIFSRPLGVSTVLQFAKLHGKPLSIPEWGIAPTTSSLSGGDDPGYVDGIAGVVRDNDVAYQSYFYAHDCATQLASSPNSLAEYRLHFGAAGDSTQDSAAAPPAPTVPDPVSAPPAATVSPAAPTAPNRAAPVRAVHRVTHRSHRRHHRSTKRHTTRRRHHRRRRH